ncbi:mechanosensitive ion channel family protein [Salidesulfovibrio onnuriiensis]|uniref:mechanosensitive ion channel family protein n=1 Tax=Salidesulfovibrio onnuriiensis TaxID=2583823 RepID=UPI0011CA5A8F|nr:mechanosensitive ion channel domain-containing protein [Salidesulfovibrio onnuriiensis]
MNDILNPDFIRELTENIITWLSINGINILIALLVFVVGRWISRRIVNLMRRGMLRAGVDETLTSFLCNITFYAMLAAVIIAALGQLGLNITSFLAVLGAAGLAVGLALKDSLSNFAAGVMIILLRFFKKGDYVTVAGTSGTVQSIKIFNTFLTTPDNQLVIVPNASILGGTIVNVTANDTRRIDMVVGIGYGDHIPKAKSILEELVASQEGVLADPAPTIAVSELADSSVNFVVRPWCKTSDYWKVRFALTEKIKMAFDEQGVNIPFPQMDVHLFKEEM